MKSSKDIKFFIFFIITMLIILLPNDAYSMQKNEKIPIKFVARVHSRELRNMAFFFKM